jgi:hypothetical protein
MRPLRCVSLRFGASTVAFRAPDAIPPGSRATTNVETVSIQNGNTLGIDRLPESLHNCRVERENTARAFGN